MPRRKRWPRGSPRSMRSERPTTSGCALRSNPPVPIPSGSPKTWARRRSTMPERVVQSRPADGVALLTLNRPEVLNALDYATLGELVDALEMLDGDESVRCVVITGAGDRAFAAGADIKEMADAT